MKTTTRKDAIQSGIAFLYKQFSAKQDKDGSAKMLDLLEKAEKEELMISFSGHFSAGKSTLINRLLGEELLPHSPIPTSANIVKITSGDPGVRVYLNNGEQKLYPDDTDLNTIQEYCRNGEEIKRIDITKKQGVIPDGVAVMDTPGIDSANDADRVITESALHLVDVLVYVMDYNHVQSEVNLRFLKEMQSRNKPVFVVINQIDKHRNDELSFSDFRVSVENAFQNWGIRPEKTFFTSLFEQVHPHNQWLELKQEINHLMKKKEELLFETVTQSSLWMVESHIKKQAEDQDEKFTGYQDGNAEELEEERKVLEEKKKQLDGESKKLEKQYRRMIEATSKNALLTPYEVREKAESFLEAHQDHFKPGLFATKNKIERIRMERKDEFHHTLQEKITANLVWKLKEKTVEFIKQTGRIDTAYLEEVQRLPSEYDPDRLLSLIKPGARLTPEYLLRYTEEVDKDIKMRFKHVFMELWKKIKLPLESEFKKEHKELDTALLEVEKHLSQVQEQKAAINEMEKYRSTLLSGFKAAEPSPETIREMETVIADRGKTENETEFTPLDTTSTPSREEAVVSQPEQTEGDFQLAEFIEKMKQAESLFQDIHGFDRLRKSLQEKRNRLEHNRFTVALFGAFSAGKSSFANALLGEEVLPVSPNPTTAVINKISPSDTGHPHGTVVTKVKSESQLLDDLSMLDIEIAGTNLDEKVASATQLLENGRMTLSVREYAFLQAVTTGYSGLAAELGQEKVIDYRELADYVAVESIACYLEWTELYYDCPLTMRGISIVDTPGADSINSRHTDVSFDYIKQADAILFVTYYNHAFSKADRDFLLQLGRVKDSFSIDKMFFILNASDLAKDESELRMVEQYVASQLIKFGIRKPRMFPLSSKQGLLEKQAEETGNGSGLDEFEHAFYRFLHNELAEIMSRSALHDIRRGTGQLDSFISSASLKKAEKDDKIAHLQKKKEEMKQEVEQFLPTGFEEELRQKVDKQFYYVQERDAIQYNDRFKEYFNPTTVTGSGSDAKEELKVNTLALLQETRHQLSQEIRAVTLRIERFVNEKASEYVEAIEKQMQKKESGLAISRWEEVELPVPHVEEGLRNISLSEFHQAISTFRNKKAFFAKNEKEIMKEHLYEGMLPHIERYLEKQKSEVKQWYVDHWQQLQSKVTESALQTIDEYYEGLLFSLTEELDIEELKRKAERLEQLAT